MFHIDFMLSYLQIYLISINIVAFIIYGYDKLKSIINNSSRVPENRLLFVTFLGGIAGSLFAMFLFRHKIKKPSFIIKYSIVVIVQVAILFLYLKYPL